MGWSVAGGHAAPQKLLYLCTRKFSFQHFLQNFSKKDETFLLAT
jgi:hypothetical protein